MTSLTNAEIKTIYFGITFLIVIGSLAAYYNQSPIPEKTYQGETGSSPSTSIHSSDWISSLVSSLPTPFNDPGIFLITSIFVTPVSIFLAYIAIRAAKDILTQWV